MGISAELTGRNPQPVPASGSEAQGSCWSWLTVQQPWDLRKNRRVSGFLLLPDQSRLELTHLALSVFCVLRLEGKMEGDGINRGKDKKQIHLIVWSHTLGQVDTVSAKLLQVPGTHVLWEPGRKHSTDFAPPGHAGRACARDTCRGSLLLFCMLVTRGFNSYVVVLSISLIGMLKATNFPLFGALKICDNVA